MKEAMKAALVDRIVSANIAQIFGPGATHLIQGIVDQICDELGIAECAVTARVDFMRLDRANVDYKSYAKNCLRSAMALEIANATVSEIKVTRDQTAYPGDVRMEMRCLVITRLPGEAVAAAIRKGE